MSTKTPITLTVDAIDDLIYDARAGDLEALKSDLAALSAQHSCPQAWIVASAIDSEPEEEGGSGSCLLHFPAANGNEGMYFLVSRIRWERLIGYFRNLELPPGSAHSG